LRTLHSLNFDLISVLSKARGICLSWLPEDEKGEMCSSISHVFRLSRQLYNNPTSVLIIVLRVQELCWGKKEKKKKKKKRIKKEKGKTVLKT